MARPEIRDVQFVMLHQEGGPASAKILQCVETRVKGFGLDDPILLFGQATTHFWFLARSHICRWRPGERLRESDFCDLASLTHPSSYALICPLTLAFKKKAVA